MSVADQLFEAGVEKGRLEGKAEGKTEGKAEGEVEGQRKLLACCSRSASATCPAPSNADSRRRAARISIGGRSA